MSYVESLLRARRSNSSMADSITKEAMSTITRRGGLGSRSFNVPDEPVQSGKILSFIQGLNSEPVEKEEETVIESAAPEVSKRPKGKAAQGSLTLGESSDNINKGYDLSQKELEEIIISEAKKRNIDPTVAIAVFRHEGAGAYQSQIAREGTGSLGGKEASFGPYQLYTGGGLGNEYEKLTGRKLTEDNTTDGVVTQIRFALDKVTELGWTPWYGAKAAGVSKRQGLKNSKAIGNWRT